MAGSTDVKCLILPPLPPPLAHLEKGGGVTHGGPKPGRLLPWAWCVEAGGAGEEGGKREPGSQSGDDCSPPKA